MSRELAGIIACLQQIELACLELQGRGHAFSKTHIQTILEKARAFFGDSNSGAAYEVLDQIRAADPSCLESEVTVDGIKSSLKFMAQELEEVLEDLENSSE